MTYIAKPWLKKKHQTKQNNKSTAVMEAVKERWENLHYNLKAGTAHGHPGHCPHAASCKPRPAQPWPRCGWKWKKQIAK